MTTLVVMSAQTTIGSLFIKAKMRFLGTVCGTAASMAIIFLCGNSPVALSFNYLLFF